MSTDEVAEALDRTALLIERDFFPDLQRDQILASLTSVHVKIIANTVNLHSAAAQTFVVMTAIALTQTGAQVTLDLDAVPLRGRQPPLTGTGNLRTALEKHLRRLPCHAAEPALPVDLIVIVGDTPLPPPVTTVRTVLRAGGDGWTAELSSDHRPSHRWTGDHPFGAALGAVAVAADAFRLAITKLSARHGIEAPSSHSLEIAPVTRLALEPVSLVQEQPLVADIISSGAITNAALATISRVPGLRLNARVFDDDSVALSNLNRYPLFSLDQIGLDKTSALGDVLPADWVITPVCERITDDSAGTHAPLADHVMIGADHIPARWIAQRHAPAWLCVSATSHFEAVISEHTPGGPCAGCIHPSDDPDTSTIPTIAFVSLLAGVLQAHRFLTYSTTKTTLPPVIAWPLALDQQHGIHALPQHGNPNCPIACPASGRTPVHRSTCSES